jgi:hypothetical protein
MKLATATDSSSRRLCGGVGGGLKLPTMRLLLLASLAVATILTPLFGTTVALCTAAACVSGAGFLSLAWGRRAKELNQLPPRVG